MLAMGLLVIFSFYILVDGMGNYSRCVKNLFLLLLTIPLTSAEPINTILLLRIGPVNVLEIAIIEVFLIGLLKKRVSKVKADRISVSVLVLLVVYVISLLMNFDNGRSIADGKDYILSAIFFLCIWSTMGKCSDSWEQFFNYALKGLRYNAYFILILYFVLWLPMGYSGRYGFPSETLYVFSIPVQIMCLYTRRVTGKNEKLELLFGTLIQIILTLISQGRSTLICICVATAFCFLAEAMTTATVKQFKRRLSYIIILVVVLIVGYTYMMNNVNSNIGWIRRMAEIVNNGFVTASNTVRSALYERYLTLIFANPLGVGFGADMPVYDLLYDGSLSLAGGETLAVDSVILTYAYKLGIVPFLLYMSCFGVGFYRFFHYKKAQALTVSVLITMGLLTLPTMIMSCQALKNLNVASFFWAFLGVLGKQQSRERKNENA